MACFEFFGEKILFKKDVYICEDYMLTCTTTYKKVRFTLRLVWGGKQWLYYQRFNI